MGQGNSDVMQNCRDDVVVSLVLLTRLPIPLTINTARGALAAWAYPIAGLVLAAIACVASALMLWAGISPGVVALITLASMIVMTGALHEDGLADTADGLWGAWTKERRLEIMKDSRIGTYGVLALCLSLLLRAALLAELAAQGQLQTALLIVAPLSRGAMPVLMWTLPNARARGLSHSVGRPEQRVVVIGAVLALLPCLLFATAALIPMLICIAGLLWAIATIAMRKIGGQTGDILGATQQLTEIAALIVLSVIW